MSPPARLLIHLVRLYQRRLGSRTLLVECNFRPSCSHYMIEAIGSHGAWRGLRLGIARLRRCTRRDLVGRLFDPVPGPHDVR